mmetsp:Transcript_38212/g.80954  ORF Transcript_38212/g.80954 Transcript_38212/m.80954 type:complete len:205 (-) Transcript_38212:140-754(-)
MEIRSARASSGSSPGSTSKPNPPPVPDPVMPSPSGLMITEERSTSLRSLGPTGTSTMWEESLLFTAESNLSNFGALDSTSPKLTMSKETLFFFKFLPRVSSSFSVELTGLPTKAMMRCFWFLFCRCFRASWAVWMPRRRSEQPPMLMFGSSASILPRSVVGVILTSIRSPAVARIPTEFSGFCLVLAPQTRLTASVWHAKREGA